MSYNLYLTHKKHWAQEDPAEKINYTDFKKYVSTIPAFKITQENKSKEILHITYMLPKESGADEFYFRYSEGDVCTTSNHTDKYAFKMLLGLAEKFGVSVQGEEGEVYTKAETESFGTYAEMNSKQAVHRDIQLSSIVDELKTLKTAKQLYRVLLVVCIVSVAGIVLLPFVIFRLRQIIKKTSMLDKMQETLKKL